jgi:adenylate kinase
MLSASSQATKRSKITLRYAKRSYTTNKKSGDKPRFVIFGPPGAGKGTQCAKLRTQYGLSTLSTGDLLRQAVAEQTQIGKRVKSILDAGQLVDDATVLNLVSGAIAANQQLQKDGFVLDGYPRNLNQADQLQHLLATNGLGLNAALCLDVSDSVLIDRICNRWVHVPSGRVYHTTYSPPKKPGVDDVTGEPLTQRDDDTEARVRDRLNVYHSQTKPLLHYYKDKGLLITITADTSHEGYELIKKALYNRYGITASTPL